MELVLPHQPPLQAQFAITPFATDNPNKWYLKARLYFGDSKEDETFGRWFRTRDQIADALNDAGLDRRIAHSKELQEELHNVTLAQLERIGLESGG